MDFYRQILRQAFLALLFACMAIITHAQKGHPESLSRDLQRAGSDTAKARLLLERAAAYRPADVTKQFSYSSEALALAGKAHWPEGEMMAEELLGECYVQVLAYNDAALHFERSIATSRKINRPDVERVCLQYIIHCYHMLNKFELAASTQKLLLDMVAQTGDHRGECNQMSAYAERLADLKRYPEAIGWMKHDINLAEEHFEGKDKMDLVAGLLNTQATIYAKMPEKDSGLLCLRRAAMLTRETGNDALYAYIISSFCDVYTAAGQRDSAIWYGEESVRRGKALGDIDLQQQYAQVLSRLYRDVHQPEAALRNYIVSDSLSEIINHPRQTMDEGMQLAKINMEQQSELNNLEKRSFEAARRRQQAALAVALMAVLVLIVLVFIINKNLREKKKSNRIISEQANDLLRQNKQIDAALEAKELMLKETHHRVKNNLQLISSLLELQVSGMDDGEASHALRTAQRRIQSIAIVHNKLHGSGGDELIELSPFVNDLYTRLAQSFADRAVRFECNIPPILLPLNMVVLLGLILNELITNTFKHAFEDVDEPAVHISITDAEGEYTLVYSDNGSGLPQGAFDAATGTSLGLYLVKRMSKQLKGTVNYTYDGGSRFTIDFRAGR